MDVREVTIAGAMGAAGYHTAIYGKWDLGSLKRFLPTSRGFDDFYGFVNTGIDYYTHERYGVPSMYRGEYLTEADKGTYCTDLFARESMRFLKQWAGSQPFFLYVPFNAPHNSSSLDPSIRTSIQAPKAYKQMYPEVDQEFRTVKQYRYGGSAKVKTPAARRRDYFAAVTCMDAKIGEMLDLLDQRGCLDNTIVIFFSDNGGSGGADNSPLRGKKSTMWEGGIRVPCIIRWPGGDVPAGKVTDEFLTSLEVFPSLIAATAADAPEGVILDGYDWWPTLRGQQPSPRRKMFWQRRDHRSAAWTSGSGSSWATNRPSCLIWLTTSTNRTTWRRSGLKSCSVWNLNSNTGPRGWTRRNHAVLFATSDSSFQATKRPLPESGFPVWKTRFQSIEASSESRKKIGFPKTIAVD